MHYRTFFLTLLAFCSPAAWAQPPLNLSTQDNRIVLVGNGSIEQERRSAYLETRLMSLSLNHSTTCRNLGWSGDSVSGDARPPGFDNPAGLDRLLKDAAALNPTILFIDYGFVESFAGAPGISGFTQNYNTLLDRLQKITPTLVLLSPTIQENNPQRDADLERYVAAVADIAKTRNLPFVDLFHPLADFKRLHPDLPLTSNGITLNDCGYYLLANETEKQLALTPPPSHINITSDKHLTTTGDVTTPNNNGLQFQLTELSLPTPPSPCPAITSPPPLQIRAADLPQGQWTLKIDGTEILTADAAKWSAGLPISPPSDLTLINHFRQSIIDSNALFYRRSRPFNDHPRHFTYIDKDYPRYDQQLADQDKVIASLRHPIVHQFEIIHKETAHP